MIKAKVPVQHQVAEVSTRTHINQANVLVAAATDLGVAVQDSEIDYWRVAAEAAAVIDTLVDERGCNDTATLFNSVIAEDPRPIEGVFDENQSRSIAAFFKSLSAERQQAWEIAATSMPEFAYQKAEARSLPTLLKAMMNEVDVVFVNALALDSRSYADKEERRKFNAWLRHFGRVGYGIDSALDMPRDYEKGVIQVPSTHKNRLRMIGSIYPDIGPCLGIGKLTLRECIKTGLYTLKEKDR